MQTVTTVGLDIAKSVFQVHCVDAADQVVVRRQLKRRYVLAFFQKLPSCLIGIEACASTVPELGSGTLATRAVANAGPTPGISSSRLLVSLDRCQALIDHTVELENLLLEGPQLGTERRETRARHLGCSFVFRIGHDPE